MLGDTKQGAPLELGTSDSHRQLVNRSLEDGRKRMPTERNPTNIRLLE